MFFIWNSAILKLPNYLPSCWQGYDRELLYTIGGNVNWSNHLDKLGVTLSKPYKEKERDPKKTKRRTWGRKTQKRQRRKVSPRAGEGRPGSRHADFLERPQGGARSPRAKVRARPGSGGWGRGLQRPLRCASPPIISPRTRPASTGPLAGWGQAGPRGHRSPP